MTPGLSIPVLTDGQLYDPHISIIVKVTTKALIYALCTKANTSPVKAYLSLEQPNKGEPPPMKWTSSNSAPPNGKPTIAARTPASTSAESSSPRKKFRNALFQTTRRLC